MIRVEGGEDPATFDERLEFFTKLATADYAAVDTESNPITGNIIGMSIGLPDGSGLYLPIGHTHEKEVNLDREEIETFIKSLNVRQFVIMHNAAHDLGVFERYGSPITTRFVDTMIMAHMVDENVPSKALDYLHKHYTKGSGKDKPPLMKALTDANMWHLVPVHLMTRYAKQDAIATVELFQALYKSYKRQFGKLFSNGSY